ncbi:DUF969 domain-containing protein [Sphingomonas morindae]|uniref:DUF969 domain-containing protein n=1 Tax=Sphingomonas morindae TaxID=1541170 RepID=A0ABY4XBJ2_9SPHN|nr:DUF969 family protein [Sphingomonas morindae]USI74326.1 DUF969 domain-containing protein [Sphingomonas morindae]
MLVLAGILVIVAGFMLRVQPMLAVVAAALVTGLAAGLAPPAILAAFGHGFNEARYVTLVYIVLPVIGLLEREGLQARARALIARWRGAGAGRLLFLYMIFRQLSAALGLTSIAGPAQTVRPLLAPMAQAAAEREGAPPADEGVAALAAATDSIGLFFGEDIFLAIGSILLMKGVLAGYGVALEPFQLSIWAIPVAVAALLIHGVRLMRLRRRWR